MSYHQVCKESNNNGVVTAYPSEAPGLLNPKFYV